MPRKSEKDGLRRPIVFVAPPELIARLDAEVQAATYGDLTRSELLRSLVAEGLNRREALQRVALPMLETTGA